MANNIKEALIKDHKSRNTLIVLGAIVLLACGVLAVSMLSGSNEEKISGTTKVAGPSTALDTLPGSSDSAEYRAKLEESNKRSAERALESGKTSIGVLTGGSNISDVSPLDMLGDGRVGKEVVVKEEVEITPPAAVELPKVNVAATPPETEQVFHAAPPPKFGTTEDYYILQMASGIWTAKEVGTEFNYTGQGNPLEVLAQEKAATVQAQAQAMQKVEDRAVAKTGDILNAVLETGINSDEPGPVIASIVSGQFKGSRLIGAAKRRNERMIVEFNTITVPGLPKSHKIDAVAIDIGSMEQASTLASSVNNHYFKKYGLLFAAALLGGYSEAIKDQGQSQVITPEGSVITLNDPNKSSKQINREAISSVGKDLGQEVKRETAGIVPTVKVNRGTAIGVLLMTDLKLN